MMIYFARFSCKELVSHGILIGVSHKYVLGFCIINSLIPVKASVANHFNKQLVGIQLHRKENQLHAFYSAVYKTGNVYSQDELYKIIKQKE